jgi:2-methylfumaryl-CoA isomerase
MADGILTGLRVVEVSAYVAAPFAGALLAGLGAEVIRIEQRGGGIDAQRWPIHDGRSLYRSGLDQGKRSVAIDLRSETGQKLAADLICAEGDNAGLVITNLPAQGWLDYLALAARRRDLVMVVIMGLPGGGTAVDYTINAGVGFPWITGPEDWSHPVNHVLPAWDVASGILATTALLAAERQRRLTGEGQLAQIALSDVALAVANHLGYLAEARLLDEPRRRYGNYIYGTFGRDFQTSDGRHVMICALTPRQWTSLGEATGLSESFRELSHRVQAKLELEGERFRHREAISELLETWVAQRTLSEVAASLDAHGVLWGPYRTFKQLVQEIDEAGEPYASPIRFSSVERTRARPGPDIGSDTQQVLRETLGLSPGALSDLRRSAVID